MFISIIDMRPASYNARGLVIGPTLCSPLSIPQCQVCKGTGALLRCDRCSRSYHLVCVSLSETQLPMGYWYCRRCWTDYETKLNEDMDRLEKRQNLRKEKLIRKFTKCAETFDIRKLLSKGEKTKKKPPADNSRFSIVSDTLPVAEDPQPGQDCLSLLISISDFCYTFRELLSLPLFSLTILDSELRRPTESTLLSRIIAGALRVILRYMFARHGTNECIPTRCAYLSLAFQTHGLYSPLEQMEIVHFPFLSELISCPMWTSSFKPGSVLANIAVKMRECPFEGYFYGGYNYQEKAEILNWLIQCLLDCPELGDTVRKITGLKPALEQKLRELKKSKDVPNYDESVASLKSQIRDSDCVTKPFAAVNSSELYCFPFDPRKICLRTFTETTEQWQIFETRRDLNKLLSLDSPYCKRKLLTTLKLVDTPQSQLVELPKPVMLHYLILMLLLFEARLRLYLQNSQKQWETPETVETWLKRVKHAQTVPEFKWLLRELAHKSNIAIKPNSAKSHYKKTFWATPEFKERWEILLENVTGLQELLLLTLYCAAHWRHFAIKKETGEKFFPVTLFKPDSKGTGLEHEELMSVEIVAVERPEVEETEMMDCEGEEEEKSELPVVVVAAEKPAKQQKDTIVDTTVIVEKPGPRTRSHKEELVKVQLNTTDEEKEPKESTKIAQKVDVSETEETDGKEKIRKKTGRKSKPAGNEADSPDEPVEATPRPTKKPRIFFVLPEDTNPQVQDDQDNSPEEANREKRPRPETQLRRSTRLTRSKTDK